MLYDSDGKELKELTQWDVNREVTIKDISSTDQLLAHIFNESSAKAATVPVTKNPDSSITFEIPNVFLTETETIYISVYEYVDGGEGKSILTEQIKVKEKTQPEDYYLVENVDYINWVETSAEARMLIEQLKTEEASLKATAQQSVDASVVSEKAKTDTIATKNEITNLKTEIDQTAITIAEHARQAKEAAETSENIQTQVTEQVATATSAAEETVSAKNQTIQLKNNVTEMQDAVYNNKILIDEAEQRINDTKTYVHQVQMTTEATETRITELNNTLNQTEQAIVRTEENINQKVSQVEANSAAAKDAEASANSSKQESERLLNETLKAKTDTVNARNEAERIVQNATAGIEEATINANNMAEEASKVDIVAWQDLTGLKIVTTNRKGEQSEFRLDEAVVHINSWRDIQAVVRGGLAKKFIKPGDIFNTNFTYGGKVHTMPWHVCDVRNVVTPEGETKEAVIIQSHLVSPEEVMFDAYEAFYVAKEELPAGTYHIVIPDAWSEIKAGDSWSFTLTKPLPAGGVLFGFENIASYGVGSTYTIKSYANVSDLTEIEAVTARVGAEGTKLGDLVKTCSEQLNSIQRISYGYNRWKESFQRQWLNNKGTGWWKPQNAFDRPPSNVASIEGFMTGFEDEFLNVLRPFKSVTAKNNVTDGGGTEETFDIFTLPALEEMYITKQVAGEGEAFPYWKEVSGKAEPFPWYQATPELIHLDVNNTARYVRLRSANVNDAYNVWNVNPSGSVYDYGGARNAFASAPLAAIY